jgi:pilus assembly protein CpaE
MSAAMDSGARGVVGLPLSYDELGARIEAAAAWASGVRRHLSAAARRPCTRRGRRPARRRLRRQGRRRHDGHRRPARARRTHAAGRTTALVDMDLQGGDIASYLDVQFRRSVADLADITDVNDRASSRTPMYVHEAGPGLLLAPGDGERGEEVTDRSARHVLHALRQRYEVVIVDCGTQMTSANAVAVEMADAAVLVTTPDVVAVRAAKRMVRMWDRLQIRKPQDVTSPSTGTPAVRRSSPPSSPASPAPVIAASVVPAAYKELQGVVDAGRLQDLDNRSTVKQGTVGTGGGVGPGRRPAGGRRRTPGKAASSSDGAHDPAPTRRARRPRRRDPRIRWA